MAGLDAFPVRFRDGCRTFPDVEKRPSYLYSHSLVITLLRRASDFLGGSQVVDRGDR
jgi:hypothetical protein